MHLCWQTVDQQFIPALAIASTVNFRIEIVYFCTNRIKSDELAVNSISRQKGRNE